ncbi:MAG TPA: hypothetical protein VFD36_29780, partial [Kofleriaceae bacterium]|nr:hypothetical protein [Kofleriaceae bacterium]
VPIAATTAVLVRYAVRFYEHTAFFGHESDADVVITPAMALIMPGVVLGARVVGADRPATATDGDPEPAADVAPELPGEPVAGGDEWLFDAELPLGPSGLPKPATPEDKP